MDRGEVMELVNLELTFAVCKLDDISMVDFDHQFVFLSKTDDEISLVCDEDFTPENAIEVERGWKGLKISGVLDFGMVGVIAKISNLLSTAQISIFVVSTFNTDYIFLKSAKLLDGIRILRDNGYIVK